ncbi:hypothetical protein LCGC14_0796270 [marine sediment metagenome]|uniref:C1q domain-containing protein n=1 Tax=marine sediment metagenome TaxID=412755 RepID=A0A0F9SY78_9ZZZZ
MAGSKRKLDRTLRRLDSAVDTEERSQQDMYLRTLGNAQNKHEQRHTKYGTDAIDSVLDEGAIALTTRGDLAYMGATDLARLAVGAADTFLGADGTDPSWRTAAQVMASLSGEATAPFSMNDQRIIELADAQDPTDAVNLRDVLDHVGITLNYWLSNQTLVELLVDSEAALTETPASTPVTLTNITFKSSVADAPTPFDINPGTVIELHFAALVAAGGGRNLGLHVVFGYMDSDSTNFVQIGNDSDSTSALTTDKTSYTLHMHVDNAIEIPAGKRLWLKFVSTSLSGGGSYPQISVYYDNPAHHLIFGVAGSVLGNFLLLSGTRAMTGELDMGTDKIINVVDPTANQDAATKKYVDDNAGGDMVDDLTPQFGGDVDVNEFAIADGDGDTKIELEETTDSDVISMDTAGNEAFRIEADGIVVFPLQSGARGQGNDSTDQDILANAYAKVQYPTEAFDTQAEFDSTTNYRYTAKDAGKYFIATSTATEAMASGAFGQIALMKNGAPGSGTVLGFLRLYNGIAGAASVYLQVMTVVELSASDFVEVYFYHDDTTPGDNKRYLQRWAYQTFLTAYKLA